MWLQALCGCLGNPYHGQDGEPPVKTTEVHPYATADELVAELKRTGIMDDVEVLVAVDCTSSNHAHGLHDIRKTEQAASADNPYLRVMRTSATLFERDACGEGLPLYYFGSVQAARDRSGVLRVGECATVASLCQTYEDTIGQQEFSAPTTFVPLLAEAMRVSREERQFHLLLIITDGDVASVKENAEQLHRALECPLSVVCVGVGPGPFDKMEELEKTDNFHFVDFEQNVTGHDREALQSQFFLQAFMEVPAQYERMRRRLRYDPSASAGAEKRRAREQEPSAPPSYSSLS